MIKGAMRGYRPQVDWGGEGGSATIMVGGHNVKVGTSGWRRRCLFLLLVSLLILAVINLLLTFYMLRKIGINAEGAGSMHVLVNGVQVDGITRLDHKIEASEIRGRPSSDLDLNAFSNLSMSVVNLKENKMESAFLFDSDGLTVFSSKLTIKDGKGNPLFEETKDGHVVFADFFTVTGEEGANFEGSVQTERLLGNDVHEFRIESKTRDVTGKAGNLLRVEARDGDVTGTALNDVIVSSGEKFRFESPNVFLSDLITEGEEFDDEPTTLSPELQIPSPRIRRRSSPQKDDEGNNIEIFQLCVCPSGKLFLAPAKSICIPEENTC